MFEQSLIQRGRTNRPWTVAVAFLGQLALVGLAVLIPLLFVSPLPMHALSVMLVAPPPPPPPPPPPAPAVVRSRPRIEPRQFVAGKLFQPASIPKHVAILKEEPLPPSLSDAGVLGGVVGGVPGGQLGGVIGGIVSSQPALPPPPVAAAPKPVAPPPPERIRVGGEVEAARLTRQVLPAYPPLARMARVQGVVELDAVIAKDGRIQSLQAVSGPPLLINAALEAVKQWVYKPTLLNGEPVEVATQIYVRFNLS
jgi:protein TonB